MLTIIKVSVIVLLIGLLVRTAYALVDIYLDGYSNRYIASEKKYWMVISIMHFNSCNNYDNLLCDTWNVNKIYFQ